MTTNTLLSAAEPQWASALFDGDSGGIRRDAYRFGSGLALAGVYGLAVGARFGLSAVPGHAVGVPLAILAVALFAVPGFYIGLAHAGMDIDARLLVAATARGAAMTGLVLAGLSPAMLLFSVTCESASSVAACAAAGLAAGSALGLRTMFRELAHLDRARAFATRVLRACFSVFVCVLAARIWAWTLPVFGGAQ